jgi:hypothetical protein
MLPPRRFVQAIAVLCLGIPGLLFLGLVEVCERIPRALRQRIASGAGADHFAPAE